MSITNSNNSNNTLLQGLKAEQNIKETENGATALKSTLSPLLDLFGQIGSMREYGTYYNYPSDQELINLFMSAFVVDKLLAMKILFYTRDIRGGLGERSVFRRILRHLADTYPDDVAPNVGLIAEYGRWDDILCLLDTKLDSLAVSTIAYRISEDLTAIAKAKEKNLTAQEANVSLLGKWLPSENTSSPKTRQLAKTLRKKLNLSSRDYRLILSALRKAINIVESKMSSNSWDDINYETLPSVAALKYREAFKRHDEDRYNQYLADVKAGTKKVNAATLYPYDLVRNYIEKVGEDYLSYDRGHSKDPLIPDETIEAQWKALPNYITEDKDFLIMADTSGSMYVNRFTPIATSIGLAIYFAERSKGAFANHFISFTDNPQLREINPKLPLVNKVAEVAKDAGYDTNLEAAFELVLRTAVKNKVAPADMPTAIVIISDMEINSFGSRDQNITFTEEMKKRFEEAGYIMPTLVYWNVNARHATFHATETDDVRFVSGSSPAVFKGLCENLGYSALELMLAVVNAPRYDAIRVAD